MDCGFRFLPEWNDFVGFSQRVEWSSVKHITTATVYDHKRCDALWLQVGFQMNAFSNNISHLGSIVAMAAFPLHCIYLWAANNEFKTGVMMRRFIYNDRFGDFIFVERPSLRYFVQTLWINIYCQNILSPWC